MRKLIYLFLALSMGCGSGVFSQNTLIPDPNFEQALIDLGYDTAPIDGQVLTANISGVTTLDVNYRNIADLTGIEDFGALTDLRCAANQLTSLDVSNNNALTSLDCDSNQLTSLDVSNNAALVDLQCGGNSLGILDVSNNTALAGLQCTSNQLTSLDVSNNNALTYLHFANNQLTSIDVTNNTALASLDCNSNQLTSLDVRNGNNTNFTLFNATNNPDLTCIFVDDVSYSTANWIDFIDPTSTFVNNEAEC